MNDCRTDVIQRLFIKQIRNLTVYKTLYREECVDDDFYTTLGIDQSLEDDRVDAAEAGYMNGYLAS